MHWAGDFLFFFESYALGNIYCGQIREAILRDVPDFENQLRNGSFTTLNAWMDDHVRQYGCCFTAGEMAQRITGKRLDAKPFLQYLEEKYKAIYRL